MTDRRWQVLAAEDDALYRSTLPSLVPWSALGCELVAMVPSGAEALSVLRSRHIDILITDVEMPGMNGIELLVNARALSPGIQCLMLSNFDTFDYVKQSLSRGADDYLLKHRATADVLSDAIRGLVARRGTAEAASGGAVGQDALDLHSMFRRDVAKALVGGALDVDRRHGAASTLFPPAEATRIAPLCFSMMKYRDHLAALAPDTPVAHFIATFLDVCQQAVGSRAVVTDVEENVFAALVPAKARTTRMSVATHMASVQDQLADVSHKFFNADLMFRSADPSTPENLAEVWRTLRSDFESDRFDGSTGRTRRQTALDRSASISLLDLEQERALFAMIVAGRADDVAEATNRIFREAASHGAPRRALLMLANDLVNLGIRVCKNRGIPADSLLDARSAPPEAMATAETLEDLAAYVSRTLVRLASRFGPSPSKNPLAQRAVAIIRSRYQEPLTLGAVAAEIGVSSSHLSRLLSAGLGHGFSEELTRARLDAACRLLEDPTLDVKQVARRCGYGNYTYFFEVFRKHLGASPQQYRAGLEGR